MHDIMVSLVERMLALHKHLRPRTPQEQEMVKREIESTDRAIDGLVYEFPKGIDRGRNKDCERRKIEILINID